MKGVKFVVDEDGERSAVLIDLKETRSSGRTSTTHLWLAKGKASLGSRWKRSGRS
jgi:hypothetical protein